MPSSGGRSLGSNIERQLGCFKQINAGGTYSCMNEAQVVRNSWSAVLNGGKRLIAVIRVLGCLFNRDAGTDHVMNGVAR